MISLYPKRKSPVVPRNLASQHWEDIARRAEDRLHSWLNLPDTVSVLLLDRATHALEACCGFLKSTCKVKEILIPRMTYRAVRDAARNCNFTVRCAETYNIVPEEGDAPMIYVPTTLGGGMPRRECWGHNQYVVYDCAHTCHPWMFEGAPWEAGHFAVLSFYPTKPCGAFGGGAIIGRRSFIEDMRPQFWPTELKTSCIFYYPQTVQSHGIIWALDAFSYSYWKKQVAYMLDCAGMIEDIWGKEAVFPRASEVLLTPHLLSVPYIRELHGVCKELDLETGRHYPDLVTHISHNLSVPFWNDALHKALEDRL